MQWSGEQEAMESGAVQWRQCTDEGQLSVVGYAPVLDRVRSLCRWGVVAHGEPRDWSRRLPPLYVAQCDGSSPTM